MNWSEDQDQTVSQMFRDGYSYTDIAVKIFGDGEKRGAVAGRIRRLNVHRPGNVIRPPASGSRRLPKKRRPEDRPIVESTERVTVQNIRPGACRWPIGDPRDTDFHFCGRSPLGWLDYSNKTSVYCCEHSSMAYHPPSSRNIRAGD